MTYKPLSDDPDVPNDAIQVCEVTVTQFAHGDGQLGLRTHYEGDLPLSSVLGLLVMASISIYNQRDD